MVFRERQTILKPVGLVTQPNAYGVYVDGALKRAENVTLRNMGELVQMPSTFGQVSWTNANHILQKLFALDTSHVYTISNSGSTWVIRESGNAVTLPSAFSTTSLFSATGRIAPVRLRERMLLNSNQGFLVADSMAPSSAADRTLRMAGMPQPSVLGLYMDTSGWFPDLAIAGYCACFVREFADGYVLRSVPSPVFTLFTADEDVQASPSIDITLRSDVGIVAGDQVELYRTDIVPGATVNTDPGTTLKRVLSQPITAANLAAGYVRLFDAQLTIPGTNTTPGLELYTNPYQEGADHANDQPPLAACTASFKGYCFYGNTTDRPELKMGWPGGIGDEGVIATYGVDATYFKKYSVGRHTGVTGTATIGSAVVTAVSAADIVGVSVGQVWNKGFGSAFGLSGATVIAVAATSFTMSINATANGVGYDLLDVFEINGVKYYFKDLGELVMGFSRPVLGPNAAMWEVTTSQCVRGSYFPASFQTGVEMSIKPIRPALVNPSQITVRASNGERYSPPLPNMSSTAKTILPDVLKNHLVWSKEQQPEHQPSVFETFVGFDELIAMNPTRDALWLWCTDGLYRLSGNGGGDSLNWGLDLVSTTLLLAAPQASSVLGEVCHGYTNQGFVGVDSAGNVDYLTDQKIGNLLPGAQYVETRAIICEANETDDELLLGMGENGNTHSDVIWVYNVKQKGWTNIKAASSVTSLRNITAMAMMRSTASGEPRILFGVSPLAAGSPSYAGWNGPTYLQCAAEYQPVYGDDPLSLKQYIWCDYLFASGGDGKTLVPLYNSIATGQITITDFQNSGYARSGVPRRFAVAHSLSVGFEQLVVGLEEFSLVGQARFQGISIALNTRTNQSKKR